MPSAIQISLSLLFMIFLGYLLRGKLEKEEHRKGLKVVILDLALPAMIFVALMGIKMDSGLLLLPVLVLAWNIVMFGIGYVGLPMLGIGRASAEHRTWLMLWPSLAPGLSCFPFLIEYLGEEALAWGALADFGNKVFVLIFAYLISMTWYYRIHRLGSRSGGEKLRQLFLAMLREPINLVLVAAILFLSFGWDLKNLPQVLVESVKMLKEVMTPLILLFIGMSVVLKWRQIHSILSLLMLRAGISLILSGFLISIVSFSSPSAILLVVVLPLSSCSFWPFAHMSGIRALEISMEEKSSEKTFDLELGINILAVSLPFSTLLILGVFSFGEYFTSPVSIVGVGAVLIFVPLVSKGISILRGLDMAIHLPENKDLKKRTSESR